MGTPIAVTNKEVRLLPAECEVLTAVVMESSIFLLKSPCGPLEVDRRFGGCIAFIFKLED
jgi:hypothetical protein